MRNLAGSSVRRDGRSASLTAPSGQAQQGLIRASLGNSAMSADRLRMGEAHGTGTALGDPIEASSLAAVVRPTAPLLLAAGKASLGHAEPAAGATGFVKLSLQLCRDRASPNAQLRSLNPHVGGALLGMCFVLPAQLADYERRAESCGGVISFGFSVTIVHAVLRDDSNKHGRLRKLEVAADANAAVVFKRRSFGVRCASMSVSVETTMYSDCWLPAAPPSVSRAGPTLLLSSSSTAETGFEARSREYRTVALMLSSAASVAPMLSSSQLALALAQTLVSGSTTASMLVLTCGTQAAVDASRAASDSAHGGVWGFARVVRLEHAGLRAQSIDMSRSTSLSASLASGSPSEPETAVRGSGRFAARLRACSSTLMTSTSLAAGTYAVTGGLGGLGLRAAELLVSRGASQVLLASRSGRVSGDGQVQLRALGAGAMVVACDSADSNDTSALLSRPVTGLLHAAVRATRV